MNKGDIEIILSKLSLMDSKITSIIKEVGSLNSSVRGIEESLGRTSSSLENMVDDSLGTLSQTLAESDLQIDDLLGNKDMIGKVKGLLEKYKDSIKT